jgi:hypothetical protein
MLGKAMAEKNLFTHIKREIKILSKLTELPGCVSLVDIV